MKRARDETGDVVQPEPKRARVEERKEVGTIATTHEGAAVDAQDDFGDDVGEDVDMTSSDVVPFHKDWMNALRIATEGKHSMYISGVPGCGKSTLARAIRAVGEKLGRKVHTLTHAKHTARLVDGQTLHSFISKLPKKGAKKDTEEEGTDARLQRLMNNIRESTEKDPAKEAAIRDADVIILDEAQSIDVVDFRALNGLVRHVCGKSKEPFGGKQVIMLADPLVGLSAITTNKEDAFYKTKTFSDVEWVKVYLTQNLRAHADSAFASMVDRLVMGYGTSDDFDALLSRRVHSIPDDGIWSTCVKKMNRDVADFNKQMQDKYSGDVGHKYGTELTRQEEKASNAKEFMNAKNVIGGEFHGPREIELFVGSQVLLISHHKGKEKADTIRAGAHGCVVSFHRGQGNVDFPVVKFVGYKPRIIQYRHFPKYFKQYGVVFCRRLPLQLAYAIKTYDIQGIGVGRITFNPDTNMKRYLPYLLTRVTSLSELFLVPPEEGVSKKAQVDRLAQALQPNVSARAFHIQCRRESTKITDVALSSRAEKALQLVLSSPESFITPVMYVPTDAVTADEFDRLLNLKKRERASKARNPDAIRREKLKQKKKERVDGFEDDADMGAVALVDLEPVPDPEAEVPMHVSMGLGGT